MIYFLFDNIFFVEGNKNVLVGSGSVIQDFVSGFVRNIYGSTLLITAGFFKSAISVHITYCVGSFTLVFLNRMIYFAS